MSQPKWTNWTFMWPKEKGTRVNHPVFAWHIIGTERKLLRAPCSDVIDGGTLSVQAPEQEIALCENGMHASRTVYDALGYVTRADMLVCRVIVTGDIDEGSTKLCGRSRTVVAAVEGDEILRAFATPYYLGNIRRALVAHRGGLVNPTQRKLVEAYLANPTRETNSAAIKALERNKKTKWCSVASKVRCAHMLYGCQLAVAVHEACRYAGSASPAARRLERLFLRAIAKRVESGQQ